MHTYGKRLEVIIVFCLTALSIIFTAELTHAGEPSLPTATIHGSALDEMSGMTNASGAGQYWGHSDSGYAAQIHRFNDLGVVLQSVQLDGATNRDFEAITRDARGRMYMADIGDNGRTREGYQIYQFSADIPAGASAVTTVRIDFRYEDNRPRNG